MRKLISGPDRIEVSSGKWRTLYTHTCSSCGKEFKHILRGREFCSVQCVGSFNATNQRKKQNNVCVICGGEFYPRRRRASEDANLCCSRECGWKYLGSSANPKRAMWDQMNAERAARLEIEREARREAKMASGVCKFCGKDFRRFIGQGNGHEFCSSVCAQLTRERDKRPLTVKVTQCIECGQEFSTYDARKRSKQICSATCNRRVAKRKRRAMKCGSMHGKTHLIGVHQASGGRCWLCGLDAPLLVGKRDGMLVNMAVVDHVRPLALGGSSTAENLRDRKSVV